MNTIASIVILLVTLFGMTAHADNTGSKLHPGMARSVQHRRNRVVVTRRQVTNPRDVEFAVTMVWCSQHPEHCVRVGNTTFVQ
jgi:hypothetical protein